MGDLAEIVLHESVHATFYVKGQSTFNESLASFVSERLVPEFLRWRKGEDSPELRAWRDGEARGRERLRRFHEAYEELDAIYRGAGTDEEKLAKKGEAIARLKADLGIAESRRINNATLLGYKTYRTGEEEFEKLLAACGEDWPRFWNALEPLRAEPARFFPKDQARELAGVVPTGCG